MSLALRAAIIPFHLRDHTAGIAVGATGESLGITFGAVGDGLAAAMCESVPDGDERVDLSLAAESREALLFDYLDQLIYQRDVRSFLPVDNDAAVEQRDGEWAVDPSARSVPLSAVTAREVKAVTDSEMGLERENGGWRAYVVFDG